MEDLDRLTELERREWIRLLQDPWYRALSLRIQLAVKETPPFFLYKMRSLGYLCSIKSYEEDKDNREAPILLAIRITPEFNKQYMFEREIWGVPKQDLEPVKLIRIARMERIISESNHMPFMRRLINTRDKDDVLRGNKSIYQG